MGYNINAEIEYQKVIHNIPFNKRKDYKCDFYIKERDLYVEVKGFMTLYAVNKLLYLQNHSGVNFYILQTTEEDWITPHDGSCSIKEKNEKNIEIQIKELLDKSIPTEELVARSKQRLNDYIEFRKGDIERWISNN